MAARLLQEDDPRPVLSTRHHKTARLVRRFGPKREAQRESGESMKTSLTVSTKPKKSLLERRNRLVMWNEYMKENTADGLDEVAEMLSGLSGVEVVAALMSTGEIKGGMWNEETLRSYLEEGANELDLNDFIAGTSSPSGLVVVASFCSKVQSSVCTLHIFELDEETSQKFKLGSKAAGSVGELGEKLRRNSTGA
jgi:hypothetical protein